MSTTISMDILARDRASRTLDHIGDKADRSAQRWATMGRVAKNAGLMVGAGLAVAATAAVKLTQAAMEDQQAAVQLATAYRNNADAKNGEIAASEKWITAQGRALGVTDDELRPALAQLVTATHDVGEAQKQASLAMNIAAGRNVALATVTKALEKAQNGSLGGLSKLGVKTKNAAGDTLSLDTITRKLADTYRGQAAKAADTAAGKFGRLKLTMTETGEAIGYKLLPYAENLTDWILNNGVPMAEDLWAAWENNGIDGVVSKIEALTDTQGDLKPIVDDVRKALGATGDIITGSLIPAVADITRALPRFMSPLGLVADTLGFMADHADLTKYAIIGLTGVLTVNRATTLLAKVASSELVTSLTMQGTAAEKAAAKQRLLGGAVRGAAGVGGMLALTAGAETSNDALGLLASAGGGAMMGFAVGGPIGAAIGGGAGALLHLATRTDEAKDNFEESRRPIADYASSLDQVTGSATKATRNLVALSLEQSGAGSQARSLGVSSRDVVSAVMGQEGAYKRVQAQLAKATTLSIAWTDSIGGTHYATVRNQKQLREYTRTIEENGGQLDSVKNKSMDLAAQTGLLEFIGRETDQWRASSRAKRREIMLSQDLRSLQGKIPPRILSKIESTGIQPTIRGVAKVIEKYNLADKRQVRAILSAVGIEPTVRSVRRVREALEQTGETRVDFRGAGRDIDEWINKTSRSAGTGAKRVSDNLETPLRATRADMSPFLTSLTTSLTTAQTRGTAGGFRVGSGIKQGTLNGSTGLGPALGAQLADSVSEALAQMRRRAGIKSPSRKTYEIGQMLAKGATDGMGDNKHKLTAAGADLMASIVKGIRKGEVPMQRVLDAVTSQVQRTLDRVKRLKDARASTVSDFKGFATSLFAAQAPESGGFSVDSLLAFQAAERDKAKSVEAAVIKLTDMGLSGSLIKQMRGQGSAGIDQLLALSQGNQAQISLANSLNAQTQAAYGAAGMNVANTMQGSEEREARRDARLAKQIAAAVHEAIQDREAKYEFVLKGNTLVAILKKEHRDNPSNGNRP